MSSAASRLTYWVIISALAAAALAFLWLVAAEGWSGLGVAGFIGCLVSVALLFSYAGSMRRRRPVVAR